MDFARKHRHTALPNGLLQMLINTAPKACNSTKRVSAPSSQALRARDVRDLTSMDEALLQAFRDGDPQAVRAIYREFARPVAAVARSVVGNDHLIDDIVQQTFTKAWKAAQSFDPSRRFAPWLFSIAHRTAIDAVRSERRPTRGDHEPESDVGVGPPSMERVWEAYEVRRAIDRLPDEEREIVELRYRIGLTQVEIAEHLALPIGTVKSRSHRAHRRLSTTLAYLREEDVLPPLRAEERRNLG